MTSETLARLGITRHNDPEENGAVVTFSFYLEPREQTEIRYGAFCDGVKVDDLGVGFRTRKAAARCAIALGRDELRSRADYEAALEPPGRPTP